MQLQTITTNFTQSNIQQQMPKKKSGILEKFHENTKNMSDMNDTILVPRTIFKGYLGIMTGTTLATIGSLLAQKLPKFSKALSLTGTLSAFYGTYAFVRPYIIKDAPGVLHKK